MLLAQVAHTRPEECTLQQLPVGINLSNLSCPACSGMLPGYVAGHYTHDECHIDLAKLARFAQARLVHATCTAIDVKNKQLGFAGRPPLRYDCLSVDIGITPDLQTVPGLDCVTPVKPIDGCCPLHFLHQWSIGKHLQFVASTVSAAVDEISSAEVRSMHAVSHY